VILRRGFRYRLMPTPAQVARLESWGHALRYLWNCAHDSREHASRRVKYDRRLPSAFDQRADLPELRAMMPWLADVPYNVCQKVLAELDLAWQLFLSGIADRPRFKRKDRDRAPMIEPHARQFSVAGEGRAGAVHFPKVGAIRAVIHRPTAGTPKTRAIVRDGDAWFACVTCEVEAPDVLPSQKPPVGIDRGVAVLLADSDRRVVENPRHGEKLAARVARAQRTVARRKMGSQNQKRAREKVARLQRKARRQREHTLHVESKHYAQKVVPEGGRVMEVRAAYSSQTCSACSHVAAENRREQDVFLCLRCGHFDNADVNAAQVILARGLSVTAVGATGEGCEGDATVRPKKQQLRVARRGRRSSVGASVETKAPAFMPV